MDELQVSLESLENFIGKLIHVPVHVDLFEVMVDDRLIENQCCVQTIIHKACIVSLKRCGRYNLILCDI